MKAQALVDHLIENLVHAGYESFNTYFPDEETKLAEKVDAHKNQGWKLYFDGEINKKAQGLGQLSYRPQGSITLQHLNFFFCSNNITKYETCIMGLNMAINLGVQELIVLGDSDLLIRQT